MRMIIQKGLHIFDQSFHALARESNYEPIPIFCNDFETRCVVFAVFTENRTHLDGVISVRFGTAFSPGPPTP